MQKRTRKLSHCPGRHCQRLTGVKIKDQSARDEGCAANCRRLFGTKNHVKKYQTLRGLNQNLLFNIVSHLKDRWQSRMSGFTVRGEGQKTESMNVYTRGTPRLQRGMDVTLIGGIQLVFLSPISYADKRSRALTGYLLIAKSFLSAIMIL